MLCIFAFVFALVIEATEGPCAANNGGCDHICTADSKIVKCYCQVGYFSIAFIPTRCFGNHSYSYTIKTQPYICAYVCILIHWKWMNACFVLINIYT